MVFEEHFYSSMFPLPSGLFQQLAMLVLAHLFTPLLDN